jgi:hypothetical protein
VNVANAPLPVILGGSALGVTKSPDYDRERLVVIAGKPLRRLPPMLD